MTKNSQIRIPNVIFPVEPSLEEFERSFDALDQAADQIFGTINKSIAGIEDRVKTLRETLAQCKESVQQAGKGSVLSVLATYPSIHGRMKSLEFDSSAAANSTLRPVRQHDSLYPDHIWQIESQLEDILVVKLPQILDCFTRELDERTSIDDLIYVHRAADRSSQEAFELGRREELGTSRNSEIIVSLEDLQYGNERADLSYRPVASNLPLLDLPDNLELPNVDFSSSLPTSQSVSSITSTSKRRESFPKIFSAPASVIEQNVSSVGVSAGPPPPPPPPAMVPSHRLIPSAPIVQRAAQDNVTVEGDRSDLLDQIRKAGGASSLRNTKLRKLKPESPKQQPNPAPDIMSALTQALLLRRKGLAENSAKDAEEKRRRALSSGEEDSEWR